MNNPKWSNRRVALVTALVFLIAGAGLTFATMSIYDDLQDTSGEIIGVGISLNMTTLDWGSLYAETYGEPYNATLQVEVSNDENYEVELTITTADHRVDGVLESPDDMFAWATFIEDGTGVLLGEYSSTILTFTFVAGEFAPQGSDFAFDIIVTAETTL